MSLNKTKSNAKHIRRHAVSIWPVTCVTDCRLAGQMHMHDSAMSNRVTYRSWLGCSAAVLQVLYTSLDYTETNFTSIQHSDNEGTAHKQNHTCDMIHSACLHQCVSLTGQDSPAPNTIGKQPLADLAQTCFLNSLRSFADRWRRPAPAAAASSLSSSGAVLDPIAD